MLNSSQRFPGVSLYRAAGALQMRLEYWHQELGERLDEYGGAGWSAAARQKMELRRAAIARAIQCLDEAETVLFAMP